MVAILLEIRDGKDDRMRVEGVYNLEIAHLFLYEWNRRREYSQSSADCGSYETRPRTVSASSHMMSQSRRFFTASRAHYPLSCSA